MARKRQRPKLRVADRVFTFPESSLTTSYDARAEIVAFDISPTKTHAILAGKHIFKTIKVDDKKCTEGFDLRTSIFNYESSGAAPPTHITSRRQLLDIHDVKWSHGLYSNYVATASINGKVVLYDLKATCLEVARLGEHNRQVHKIAFNPHQGFLLLSACHSGTVKLWDIRQAQREVATIRSKCTIDGHSEAVRALEWSPKDGVELAIGTEQGTVQRWDYRFPRTPKLKIQGHSKCCTAIDWHPDGKHLVSTSLDQTVKVWDFSSSDGRQQPVVALRTPFSTYKVRWRPSCLSIGSNQENQWQCTQIATSYDQDHTIVHVWDFRRPHVPFRELNRYRQTPTGMMWKDQHLLWTVGHQKMFIQADVHFAPRTADRRPMSAFAIAPDGKMALFIKKRQRRPEIQRLLDKAQKSAKKTSSGSTGQVVSAGMFFPVKSALDDSLDESFLRSARKLKQGRTSSLGRSPKSLGNTPPSLDDKKNVMPLNTTISDAKSLKRRQKAIRVLAAPGLGFDVEGFRYIAQNCSIVKIRDSVSEDGIKAIKDVCERYAYHAEQASHFANALTWRILGFAMEEHLLRMIQREKDQPGYRSDSAPKPNTDECSPQSQSDPNPHKSSPQTHINPNTDASSSQTQSDPNPHESSPQTQFNPNTDASSPQTQSDPKVQGDMFEKPFDLLELGAIKKLIDHYSEVGDAQMASLIILQITPILRGSHPQDSSGTDGPLLNRYAQILVEEEDVPLGTAQQALERYQDLINLGISPSQAESILSTYHHQLLVFQLDDEAASLRELCYPEFPAVWRQNVDEEEEEKVVVAPLRRQPAKDLPCPLCSSEESPFAPLSTEDRPQGLDLTVCSSCGHGGHFRCLHWWFKEASVACPVEGCGCLCQQAGAEEAAKGKGKEGSAGPEGRQGGLEEEAEAGAEKVEEVMEGVEEGAVAGPQGRPVGLEEEAEAGGKKVDEVVEEVEEGAVAESPAAERSGGPSAPP